jgi:hypothetical protein
MNRVFNPMIKLMFYIPDSLKLQVEQKAKQQGINTAEAIRQAIAEWVSRN